MFWFNSYLDAQVDTYKSLNFVGVMNGFGFMILVWIVIFTSYHVEEEGSLGKVIGEVVRMGGDVVGGDGGAADDTAGSAGGMEDEF